MSRKKSKDDIIRNEEYMDDAVSSVFFNLHKAAKRKNDYIWATNTFTSSLDSIWSEPQTVKVFDDKSSTSKNDKPLKCLSYDVVTKPSTSHVNRSNLIEFEVNPSSAWKTGRLDYEENRRKLLDRKSPLLKNFVEDETKGNKCKNETEYSNLKIVSDVKTSSKLKSYSQTLNDKLCENRVKQEIHKSNPDFKSRVSDVTLYEKRRECLQLQQNSSNISPNKTENKARNYFGDTEQTIRFTNFRNGERSQSNKDIALNSNGNRMSNCPRSKMNTLVEHLKEKDFEVRKRHLSTSVNSLLPEQKHLIVDNQKHTKLLNYEEKNILKTMLLLKVFKGEKMHDFMLELSDFNRIKERYPKLKEVFPEINKGEKEMAYSVDAVKVVFGFLCNLPHVMPDDKTSVEVLAACKSCEIDQFHAEFQKRFLKNLKRDILAYKAAVYYNLRKICDAYKRFFSENDLSSDNRPYKQRKCCVSVSTYIEPLEFCIPSKIATSTLQDNFDRDIRNEITFKAVRGSYVITGFHILLNLDNEKDFDSAYLDFFYLVQNMQNSYEEELKLSKQCRPIIVINLNRNLEVHEDQTAEIVIETTIKPFLCSAVQENDIIGRCNGGKFCMNIKSTYKVANSVEKRFFIGKLLYHPKT